ncbi:uncharacterized protein LOC129807455 [Phlebotomus papatasi]|uniref:uncharacterized protein LOC129807455 n=1 Tax=Phlebotomus papatasi TaxID=29031 RepID=UPI0024841F63|nr:uncharacterized protein LOC129807455 [Phlebotomus papatasi]
MKPRGRVWGHFTSEGGTKKQKCFFCDWCITENAFRMKEHLLLRCPNVPPEVKQAFDEDTKASPKSGGATSKKSPAEKQQASARVVISEEQKIKDGRPRHLHRVPILQYNFLVFWIKKEQGNKDGSTGAEWRDKAELEQTLAES